MSDVIKLRSSVAGKGDRPRPSSLSHEEQAASYCRIFGHQFRKGTCRNCKVTVEEWYRTTGVQLDLGL